MSCNCDNKRAMSDRERVASLAKKAAVMEGCIYAVFHRSDGTYGFGRNGSSEIDGEIVELKHYL